MGAPDTRTPQQIRKQIEEETRTILQERIWARLREGG